LCLIQNMQVCKKNYLMYHVCIFTDSKNQKFIIIGGSNEAEVKKNLDQINSSKNLNNNFNKLVIFKSYLMDQEGVTYLNYISKFEQKELLKLVISENSTFSDQTKHLIKE
jgi:hypothetical protein